MSPTELSIMWGGLEVGDAVYAPYGQSYLRSYHRTLLNAYWMRQKFCVIPSYHSSYNGLLAPSNPAGTTLRMASGVALVEGFLYTNDANIDFSLATAGYYRLVLRRDYDNHKVTAVVLGPSTVTYPEALYYFPDVPYGYVDVPVAQVYSDGATLTIVDERTFFRNICATKRQGGNANNFYSPGTTAYVIENLSIQVGVFAPAATTGTVTLPESYETVAADYGEEPVVFLQGNAASAPIAARLTVTAIGAVGEDFSWAVDDVSGLDEISWIAIGGICRRNPPI